MDQTFLLGLAAAVIVGLVAVGAILARPRANGATTDGGDTTFAVSTEGMKVCPSCGMGNLWTETSCSSCGTHLKG